MHSQSTPSQSDLAGILRGVVGSILGAAAGGVLFWLILQLGLYAIVIPGAMAGMGGGWSSRIVSNTVGLLCAFIAALATVFCEWYVAPFLADASFVYFISHLHKARPIFLIIGAIGVAMAFHFGRGRPQFVTNQR